MYTNILELDLNSDYNDSEKFINKKYTFNNNEYNIIKYNKETLYKYQDNEDYFNILSKYR